jgi:YegS/Rv2252/BmrU family lipid kinase
MKERIAYIINPISGTSEKQPLAAYLQTAADSELFDTEICYTRCVGDGAVQSKKFADAGYARVIAVGGDGTVNEVARGLIYTDTALGIIPLGSGNGLARHIRMPLNYQKANKAVLSGKIVSADCGLINERHFFCTSGAGFDAQVGQRFAMSGKRGFVSYAEASFKEYVHYKPQNYRITINGDITFARKAFLITFANASQWGYNAYISPDASLNDGMLDLVIVSPFPLVEAPVLGVRMFTKRLQFSRKIEIFRVKEAVVERESGGCIHIDGDSADAGNRLEIRTLQNVLKLIIPDEKINVKKLPFFKSR